MSAPLDNPESSTGVEEVQGLFGPFQFPELLLQRIWAEQSFNTANLRTLEGEVVKIESKGRWNRLGGPDFKDARVTIGDVRMSGDIEVHLRERDWRAHGHGKDAHYDNVMLHVVLFPPKVARTEGAGGRRIPIIALLPQLWHDLEEYATDAAMTAMAARPMDLMTERWMAMSWAEAREELREKAHGRWRQKVHYAHLRIARLGWRGACHHTALEILGYKFNRAPMLQVATNWPLSQWIEGRLESAALFEALRGAWKLQGVRPANHPRIRLMNYAKWVKQGGDWPEKLSALGKSWPTRERAETAEEGIAVVRRKLGFANWWRYVMAEVGAASAVASPRADNLWGDGFLPLLAAGGHLQEETGFQWWFGARPGDQPETLIKAARRIGFADGRRHPLAWGQVQGLIGGQLEGGSEAPHRT